MSFRSGSGIHFTDPREFYRAQTEYQSLCNITDAGTAAACSSTGFYTEQARRGVSDNTNWTADIYKTLLSVTGMGLVSNLLGPASLAGTPTTTFRITVDGTVYTVPIVLTTTAVRAVLGAVSPDGNAGTAFTTAKVMDRGGVSITADKTTQYIGNNGGFMPWSTLRLLGTPCLIFRQSILIEAKSSESNSTTTNQDRQSCVQYMVMA